jgi:phage baseplate assembly protein gpV
MLVFGKVTYRNFDDYTVKLLIEELDNFETPWLQIPQLFTVNNKSGYMPDLHSLVAAYLNEDMTEGIVLGSIYNDLHKVLLDYKGDEYIKFADGVLIKHVPNSKKIEIFSQDLEITGNTTITGKTVVNGNITINGTLKADKVVAGNGISGTFSKSVTIADGIVTEGN